MAFRVLFMHVYALLQIYVISFRSTVSLRALRYLFLVGGLACVPAAIAGELFIRHYFQEFGFSDNHQLRFLRTCIEESAKAIPMLYLMYRTRVGASSSPLDGLLYGAAVGAGFGFAEDAIFMIENASIGYSPFTTVPSILSSWLPGGWQNYSVWFPGHMVLAAMVGASVGLGRRLIAIPFLRFVPPAVALGWMVLVHAAFNNPSDPGVSSFSNFIYYKVCGSGQYLSVMLAVVAIALLVLDERYIRRKVALPDGPPARSIFSDMAALIEGAGKGWRNFVRVRGAQRHEEELLQLQWEIAHLRPKRPEEVRAEIAAIQQHLRQDAEPQPPMPARRFWSFKGLGVWGIVYRGAKAIVRCDVAAFPFRGLGRLQAPRACRESCRCASVFRSAQMPLARFEKWR